MASTTVLSAAPRSRRRLEGKVALITWEASGIGEAVAKLFSQHGANVIIADILDKLGQSVCNNLGPTSSYIHCDVTDEAQVRNAVDSTVTRYGKLDIMFNNAGIVGSPKPNILDVTQSEFEEAVKVNLIGPFLGTKHAARVMIPAQQGSIITMPSLCANMGGVAAHAYTGSKHGVAGLTKNVAIELGKYGIRVNCVSPHVVSTPIARNFYNLNEENIKKYTLISKGIGVGWSMLQMQFYFLQLMIQSL